MIKKKSNSKKITKATISNEDRQSIIKKIAEDSQKNRFITYESVMEFGEKYKFNEEETNQLLKELEKRNVDLIMQEELHIGESTEEFVETEEKTPHKITAKLATTTLEEAETILTENKVEKLLLVDEPVAGMTDAETESTAELLREIARDHSVVVVEHDMSFVRALGVRVTVLHEGSVLAEGPLSTVSSDPRVIEVYLGR